MDKYRVKLTFTEPILGTVPMDKEVYKAYIQSLSTDEMEVETVENREERGWTGFHKEDEQPFLFDYVIKGFFKDACGLLRRASDTKSAKLRAHKKVIDGLVFIVERRLLFTLPPDEDIGVLERPLRAATAQGERITLARSDTCPAGTTLEFTLAILGGVSEVLLKEWLDYGALRGIGQWRNASYGRFTYELDKLG